MPSDRVTLPVRVYRGDYALITRTARSEAAKRNKKMTPADVIHGLCAQLREEERGE